MQNVMQALYLTRNARGLPASARRYKMPGRLCEVKYKEISYDKNTGAESLQFPVFISIRTDKDEVSYG